MLIEIRYLKDLRTRMENNSKQQTERESNKREIREELSRISTAPCEENIPTRLREKEPRAPSQASSPARGTL